MSQRSSVFTEAITAFLRPVAPTSAIRPAQTACGSVAGKALSVAPGPGDDACRGLRETRSARRRFLPNPRQEDRLS